MIIEEGKRYVRRDGSISGPISEHSLKIYCWTDGKYTYSHSGRWSTENYETSLDLIEEYKEPEMKEIDFEKPLRFVDNADELKYIGLDSRGFHVVEIVPVNALMQVDRYGKAAGWQDVENIPEKITRWCNFYPSGSGGTHATREQADRSATSERIACVPVTFEPGEGL
jgi:hypothetical protein